MDIPARLYRLAVSFWSPAGSLGVLVNQIPLPVI